MNTLRLVACVLLPVVLVVTAAPLQDSLNTRIQNLHFDTNKAEADFKEILETDPSYIHQIDPDSEQYAAWTDVKADKNVVLERLTGLTAENEDEGETDEGESYEANAAVHHRRKRQTVLSGDVNVDKQRGGRRITGSLGVDHAINSKHSVGGSVGIDHTKIKGLGSSTDYNAGLKYSFNPSRRTSLSLGATRNWGSSGRGTSFGLSFSHKF